MSDRTRSDGTSKRERAVLVATLVEESENSEVMAVFFVEKCDSNRLNLKKVRTGKMVRVQKGKVEGQNKHDRKNTIWLGVR